MTDTDLHYAPGTRWCLVASYCDGSAIRGVYGPYPSKSAAENAGKQLREIGVYDLDEWQVLPLRKVNPGTSEAIR